MLRILLLSKASTAWLGNNYLDNIPFDLPPSFQHQSSVSKWKSYFPEPNSKRARHHVRSRIHDDRLKRIEKKKKIYLLKNKKFENYRKLNHSRMADLFQRKKFCEKVLDGTNEKRFWEIKLYPYKIGCQNFWK